MVAMTFNQDSMSEILPVSTNLRPCVLWKAPPILLQNWLGVEIHLSRERQCHFTDGQKGRCVYWTQLCDPHQLLHCPVRAHGHSEWERGTLHWEQWEELGPQAEFIDACLGAFLTEELHGSSCDSKCRASAWSFICERTAAHQKQQLMVAIQRFISSWAEGGPVPPRPKPQVYLLFCA